MEFKIKQLFVRVLNLNSIKKFRHVSNSGKFRLGNWLVEPELSRISRAGQQLDLQPQVMDLLVYLVTRHKEVVSNEELLSELWEDRVVTSASIYSSLKQLRAALGDDVRNPTYIRTIPKRGYRLIADLEFIESTQGNDQQTAAGNEVGLRQKITSHPVALALLAVTVITLSYLLFQSQQPIEVQQRADVTTGQSIAVLPFTDMTQNQDHGWFSDGMAEEILNKLAQSPGLKVAGRTSSFSFRNSDANIKTIGNTLGVSHLLEGSIRRDGDRIRITAQLIRADDGFHVWSQEYDRQLSDTIAIQDDISASIANMLLLNISGDAMANPNTTPGVIYPRYSAYELYLQSLELIHLDTKLSLMSALDKLERSLAMEPGFAEAHVAIARVYGALTNFSGFYGEDTYKESDDLVWPHLEKALAINPGLAEVQLLLGDMSDQPDEALQAYNKALSINPNLYQAHMSLAVMVLDQLRPWSECVTHLERALEIEPLSVEAATMMILFLQSIPHRWQEAEDMLTRLEQQYPQSSAVQRSRARWLLWVRGYPADAAPILQDLLVRDPDDAHARALQVRSWYMLGETDRALESRIGNPYWRFVLAPDREESLKQMAETIAVINTWPREETYAHRMLFAYAYVMLHEWQTVIDLLADDLRDLEEMSSSKPMYVQQLGRSESAPMSLAVAYKKLGDTENFEKYAAFERMAINVRSENGRLHNIDYSRAMARLDALEGRPHEALLELEHLVTNGRIDPRDLLHPAFDEIRDTPDFKRLESLQLQRVNSEREKLGLTPLPGPGSGSVAQVQH